MGTILTEKYDCVICGKKCRTDKLGYAQGMFSVWKYGSHSDAGSPANGRTCGPCLKAITNTIRKLKG